MAGNLSLLIKKKKMAVFVAESPLPMKVLLLSLQVYSHEKKVQITFN